MEQIKIIESQLYSNFIDSLRSEATKTNYSYCLKKYMQFHKTKSYSSLLVTPEDKIKSYVIYLREKGASGSQHKMLFSTLKNFYEMNDIESIKWRKLKRYVGEEVPEHEDRCYSNEEIQTLVQGASSMKLKATILLMSSSGLRIGALPTLKTGHLERRGDIYKISVYKGLKGKGQYYTFCTPECAKAIDSYLEYRERWGEKINPESPLFRVDFDITDHGQARNLVHTWSREGVLKALHKALVISGIREIDHTNPRNRKDVKISHGFRKFFVTMLVNSGLSEVIISKLTGHTISRNLIQVYSKQTEEEMLAEYSKAIDSLTIDPNNRLKRKIEYLTVEKNKMDILEEKIAKLSETILSKQV